MIVVFTNGCFDLVHPAHVDFLGRARALGDRLVVGLNSDASVRAIRGPGRPLVPEDDRRRVLAALRCVDDVVVFDEPTPARLIDELRPDVLVKGGDWPVDQIVGAEAVRRHGGRVVSLPLVPGYSTTALIERIRGGAVTPPRDAGDDVVARALGEHREVAEGLLAESAPAIRAAGEGLAGALRTGARLCVFGDDESALAVRHFERTFSGRLGTRPERGDVALALSASGESSAVLADVMSARERGCLTVGLTGAGGKRLASLCDLAVLVPSDHAPRVREAHVLIGHLWGELLDG